MGDKGEGAQKKIDVFGDVIFQWTLKNFILILIKRLIFETWICVMQNSFHDLGTLFPS